ncbi:peroxiredoxin [Agromyces sp. NPDC058484]|uniref:peroxiredoxin n=1 Tax=Agromyces sp. NPDC058484 TaxID=3346524 RepID=UPI00365DCB66
MILRPGTAAPDFALPNQFGQPVSLASFRGMKRVTLVFFPLAFSSTCQGELRELRDNLTLFFESDTELLGVSVDSKHTLRAWAEEQGYGFQLLADFWPHGEVARSYGAFLDDRGYANRATFVIDEQGVIRSSFASAPGEARTIEQYRVALSR